MYCSLYIGNFGTKEWCLKYFNYVINHIIRKSMHIGIEGCQVDYMVGVTNFFITSKLNYYEIIEIHCPMERPIDFLNPKWLMELTCEWEQIPACPSGSCIIPLDLSWSQQRTQRTVPYRSRKRNEASCLLRVPSLAPSICAQFQDLGQDTLAPSSRPHSPPRLEEDCRNVSREDGCRGINPQFFHVL